jgi:hypothetical protein
VYSSPKEFWNSVFNKSRDRRAAILHWKLLHKSLPTGQRLTHILPNKPDVELCKFCDQEEETAEHLFTACPLAKRAWDFFVALIQSVWPSHQTNPASRLYDLVLRGFPSTSRLPKLVTHAILAVHGDMLRAIWLDRNDAAFNNVQRSLDGIVNRFLVHLSKTTFALLIGASRRKKVESFLKTWAQQGILVKRQEGGKPRIVVPAEVRALVSQQ